MEQRLGVGVGMGREGVGEGGEGGSGGGWERGEVWEGWGGWGRVGREGVGEGGVGGRGWGGHRQGTLARLPRFLVYGVVPFRFLEAVFSPTESQSCGQ